VTSTLREQGHGTIGRAVFFFWKEPVQKKEVPFKRARRTEKPGNERSEARGKHNKPHRWYGEGVPSGKKGGGSKQSTLS